MFTFGRYHLSTSNYAQNGHYLLGVELAVQYESFADEKHNEYGQCVFYDTWCGISRHHTTLGFTSCCMGLLLTPPSVLYYSYSTALTLTKIYVDTLNFLANNGPIQVMDVLSDTFACAYLHARRGFHHAQIHWWCRLNYYRLNH